MLLDWITQYQNQSSLSDQSKEKKNITWQKEQKVKTSKLLEARGLNASSPRRQFKKHIHCICSAVLYTYLWSQTSSCFYYWSNRSDLLDTCIIIPITHYHACSCGRSCKRPAKITDAFFLLTRVFVLRVLQHLYFNSGSFLFHVRILSSQLWMVTMCASLLTDKQALAKHILYSKKWNFCT